MIKRKLFVVILVLFMGLSVSAVTLEELNDSLLELGFSIPRDELPSVNFTLANLNGVTEELEDYRGSVVFLNFWATWCGPCRMEMPSMQVLYDTYQEEGLEILAVNQGESKRVVENFIEDNGYTYPVLMDTNQMVGSMYGVRGIPTTYIIDRDGNILSMLVGTREWNTEEIFTLFDDILAY